jgi:hypothetical protein
VAGCPGLLKQTPGLLFSFETATDISVCSEQIELAILLQTEIYIHAAISKRKWKLRQFSLIV